MILNFEFDLVMGSVEVKGMSVFDDFKVQDLIWLNGNELVNCRGDNYLSDGANWLKLS